MQTQELGITLTGFQRFQLTKLWHKRGREGNREEFIKKVCEQKNILYSPPIRVTRVV